MIELQNDGMEISDEEISHLLEEIFERFGFDFRYYSRASLTRRLKRFLSKENLRGIQELSTKIFDDSYYLEHFLQELTVNVTEMFRDPSFFNSLRKNVVPFLSTYPHIKIWDAGCSTGEELFSLAIMLREENLLDRTRIFATDINQKVLNKAKEGIFDMAMMATYSRNYLEAGGKYSLSEYYTAHYDYASFDKSLIQKTVFYPHNLAADSVFNEFQLIICRNVLIYFDKVLQETVLKLFEDSLPSLGFLALGKKESMIWSKTKAFRTIDKEERIFQKIE